MEGGSVGDSVGSGDSVDEVERGDAVSVVEEVGNKKERETDGVGDSVDGGDR